MDISLLTKNELDLAVDSFIFSGTGVDFVKKAISDDGCEIGVFSKGELVYSESEFRRSIGLVVSGAVEASKRLEGGKKYIMNVIPAGGFFGSAALFSKSVSYVTRIEAVSSGTRIVFFEQELVEKLIDRSSTVSKNYIRFLSDRINFLNKKVQSLAVVSTSKALSRYLITNMEKEGDDYVIKSHKSYSALAQMLNIGRASLYRSLEEFEKQGYIRRDGKKIVVLDPQGLIK